MGNGKHSCPDLFNKLEWSLLVDVKQRISTQGKKIKEKNMKIFILLVAVYLERCSALYFHMGETEKKCFLEEIPDETMVTGTYHWLGLNMGLSCTPLILCTPESKQLMYLSLDNLCGVNFLSLLNTNLGMGSNGHNSSSLVELICEGGEFTGSSNPLKMLLFCEEN